MIRLIGGLFSLLALGGLAGLGSVGLAIWLYGQDLPSTESLANYEPATLTRVYSGEGRLIAEFAEQRRIFTPVDEIPEQVKNAFISAEDKNFYTHPGVDPMGIARAMVANIQALRSGGGRLQGASTITQQVMKNFLVGDEYSVERKIKEAILALRISDSMSKDKILELYLNEIFLGQNAYGVTAAAQRYFGKPLEALTVGEAAYLAALPKAPSDLHPVRQQARAVGRRNYVLREMFENGHIDRETLETAREEPLTTLLDDDAPAPEIARPTPPSHFTEEVRRRLTAELGADALFGGGLTVRATIEPDLQDVAERALSDRLLSWSRERESWRGPVATLDVAGAGWTEALRDVEAPRDVRDWRLAVVVEGEGEGAALGFEDGGAGRLVGEGPWAAAARGLGEGDVVHVSPAGDGRWRPEQVPEIQGAFMAMDVETGRVLALQGGFSYQTSVFNRATQADRQPGSSFKPFVYAAALEAGYGPDTMILDAPIVVDQGTGELWKPKNSAGDFLGPAPMRQGLIRSRNLMTIRLAQEVGMENVADAAERFGVYDDMPPHLSYALGAGETTLWELVASYAMFANGGWRIEPTVVDRVQDRRGHTIWRHDQRRCPGCGAAPGARPPKPERDAERVLNPLVAQQIVGMLRGVVTEGTAARPFAGVDGPVAGKTGTTNEARDVWFLGFSPTVAAGCFIGYDEPRPIGRGAFGGTLCAPVVADFFRAYFETRPAGDFEALDRAAILAAASGEIEQAESDRVIGGGGAATSGLDDAFFAAQGDFTRGEALSGAGEAPNVEQRAEAAGSERPARPAPPSDGGFATPGGLY